MDTDNVALEPYNLTYSSKEKINYFNLKSECQELVTHIFWMCEPLTLKSSCAEVWAQRITCRQDNQKGDKVHRCCFQHVLEIALLPLSLCIRWPDMVLSSR